MGKIAITSPPLALGSPPLHTGSILSYEHDDRSDITSFENDRF